MLTAQPLPLWQADSIPNERRQRQATWTLVGGAAVTYTALSVAWYGGEGTTSFRFFDDSHEWLQLDKVGHVYGAYQISRVTMDLARWSGQPRRKVLWAGMTGFLLMTPIELLDGISPAYGASWSDIAANAAGSGLAVLNEAIWRDQVLTLKFSYHPTDYPRQRPDLLGSGLDQLIKDYNGQTYWLCLSVDPLLPEGRFREAWPDWLGIAVGYGGRGLIGGYGRDDWAAIRNREVREFYLSLDIDLRRIRTRRPGPLRTLLSMANSLRIPLPAIQFDRNGTNFRPLYF